MKHTINCRKNDSKKAELNVFLLNVGTLCYDTRVVVPRSLGYSKFIKIASSN